MSPPAHSLITSKGDYKLGEGRASSYTVIDVYPIIMHYLLLGNVSVLHHLFHSGQICVLQYSLLVMLVFLRCVHSILWK